MSSEYDTALVEGYARMHAHFGELLDIYSQPICCEIMDILEKEGELTVSEIKQKIRGIQSYMLSKHLTLLLEKKHIVKKGKIYSMNNNLFYTNLNVSTKKMIKTLGKKTIQMSSKEKAMTASLYATTIYDQTTNILIHILLSGPRTLKEIVDMYRCNHSYITSNVVRYHLSKKKFFIFNDEIEIFNHKSKRYALTTIGKEIHDVFDEFMSNYLYSNEEWMRKVWSIPIREIVSDRVSMALPGDKFFKVLRMLGKTDFVIVRSNYVEGILTIQQAMSIIGKVLDTDGFWGGLIAKEVMIPLKDEDVLSGNATLKEIYAKKEKFDKIYYVVDLGGKNYGVLDLNQVSKIMNNT